MVDRLKLTRRAVLGTPLVVRGGARAGAPIAQIQLNAATVSGPALDRSTFGFTGVYDVDWLPTPLFARMLNSFAASPGAFAGIRFFGAFTAGQSEALKPDWGGVVWTDPSLEPDFSISFAALDAIVSRGLIPFVSLGFFPPALSPAPIDPPPTYDGWKRLVSTFLAKVADDARFGENSMRDWWFEVWNEPNEGRFWSGTHEDYLDLYRATSEAVTESGLEIRLGGPAIAWKPEAEPDDGPPWMERFLRFIASDPALRCDFVSYHRKGTVDSSPPDPRRLHQAALDIRALMNDIDADRFAGVTIVNNEADEKVGFETPYAPRINHINASWLAAATAIQGSLGASDPAHRYMAAADNANLHLVQEPFDGRRSLMTYAQPDLDELIRVPAYGFYEMLRFLHGESIPVASGEEHLFPATDLYQCAVADEDRIAVMLTWYPDPAPQPPPEKTVSIAIHNLPWQIGNIAEFRIDAGHSNAWSAAGGSASNPFPKPDASLLSGMRHSQGLTIGRPVEQRVKSRDRTWSDLLTIAPFTTLLVWLTPWSARAPVAPAAVVVAQSGTLSDISWPPSTDPDLLTYEVYRMTPDQEPVRISPVIHRAAEWTESIRPPGTRFAVRTISASGIASPFAYSE